MSDEKIQVPRPHNLRGSPNIKLVEHDVYNICNRVKELDPNLYIVLHQGHDRPWVVMEHCRDNVDRFVSRYKELTPQIIDDLHYMLAVPFEKRLEEAERRVEAHNAQYDGISDEKMDRFLWDFDKAARASNLYDPVWGKSFAKIAPKQRQKKEG